MAVFKANFLAGVLVGAALAVAAPFAGAEMVAALSAPAKASVVPQTVNRAAKSDRLHPHDAVRNAPSTVPKILEGCDPAFSPLSKGAGANFSSRCLA